MSSPNLEAANYWNDPRVRAALVPDGIESIGEQGSTPTVTVLVCCNCLPSCAVCPHRYTQDGDGNKVDCDFYAESAAEGYCEDGDDPRMDCEREMSVTFPAHFAVCGLCQGTGKVVDPNIDCDGLSPEDFEDSDFEESYHAGAYDITCPQCKGLRVVPEVDAEQLPKGLKVLYNAHRDWQGDEADYAAERAAERRMGC